MERSRCFGTLLYLCRGGFETSVPGCCRKWGVLNFLVVYHYVLSRLQLKDAMLKVIVRAFTHRGFIASFNIVIVLISVMTLWDSFSILTDVVKNPDEMEAILDGLGTIFVAYGVALEERETLMEFFHFYPDLHSATEKAVDRHCHLYGLLLLIFGLFMEVSVEVVKIPDRFLDTSNIEGYMFGAGLLCCLASIAILLIHTYLLASPLHTPVEVPGEGE